MPNATRADGKHCRPCPRAGAATLVRVWKGQRGALTLLDPGTVVQGMLETAQSLASARQWLSLGLGRVSGPCQVSTTGPVLGRATASSVAA